MPTHDPSDFERMFGAVMDDVLQLLSGLAIPHMLIGGLAVAVRAEPRATKDIDLEVRVAPPEAERMISDMSALGFRVATHGPPGPGAVIRFVRTEPDGIERWVDVLCAGTAYEELALQRATEEHLLGRSLPVASIEDLVILKLLAGRPQDLADVDSLLREAGARIDDGYLDARAADWGIEDLLLSARTAAARVL